MSGYGAGEWFPTGWSGWASPFVAERRGSKVNITASADSNGWLSPSGTVLVPVGGSQSFIICPSPRFCTAEVLVDGVPVGPVSSYTFAGVSTSHSIRAVFAPDPAAVVVAAADSPQPAAADLACGAHADQAVIQEAIARALASRSRRTGLGRLQLLAGRYVFNGSLHTPPGLIVEGQGYDSLIFLADGSHCHVITNEKNEAWAANVTLAMFRIDGNGPRQHAGDAIARWGPSPGYDSLWIEGVRGSGITHGSGDNARVVNNQIRGCTGAGISVVRSETVALEHNRVLDCGLGDPDDNRANRSVSLYRCRASVISHNLIEGGGSNRQISAWDCPGVRIVKNHLRNGRNMGIAPHSRNAMIEGNTIVNCDNNAIDTCGETDCWIERNHVSGVGGRPVARRIENTGICLNTSRSTCTGNYVELCGAAGIHLVTGNNDNRILHNTIKNCGRQGSIDGWGYGAIWIQILGETPGGIVSGCVIRNNICTDDQSTKTQKYGVQLTCGSRTPGFIRSIQVVDNDLRGNAVGPFNDYDLSRVTGEIHDNLGADV